MRTGTQTIVLVTTLATACTSEPLLVHHTAGTALNLIHGQGLIAWRTASSPLELGVASPGDAAEELPLYFTTDGRGPFVADERLQVRLAPHTTLSQLEAIAAAHGATLNRAVRAEHGVYELRSPSPSVTVALAAELHRRPELAWAHADLFQPLVEQAVPNDPLLLDQWHHGVLDSFAAWNVTTGSSSVRIAVLDSGIELGHPDLAAKVVDPRDTLDGDDRPSADEDAPHGTACAGLAAAVTSNGTGIAGVCPDCSLMPLRIGSAGMTRVGAIADAIYWAVDHGARVISNSWYTPMSANLETALSYAANEAFDGRGAVILFAAGNDGAAIPDDSPAQHPDVLAIGATNPYDVREGYSNVGAALDLVAPAGLVTTDLLGAAGYAAGDYVVGFGGTSAATPVAAGVAGLLLSRDPELTRRQVTALLHGSTDQVEARSVPYTDGRNDSYGFGRINAAHALEQLTRGWGRTCTSETSCGSGGACVGTIGGQGNERACALACQSDADCPGSLACRALAGGGGACLATCELNFDCRGNESCWPEESGAGHCMAACTFDSDCNAGGCNDFGLCGDITPPGEAFFTPLIGVTSCTGASSPFAGLLALALLARRRRSR